MAWHKYIDVIPLYLDICKNELNLMIHDISIQLPLYSPKKKNGKKKKCDSLCCIDD